MLKEAVVLGQPYRNSRRAPRCPSERSEHLADACHALPVFLGFYDVKCMVRSAAGFLRPATRLESQSVCEQGTELLNFGEPHTILYSVYLYNTGPWRAVQYMTTHGCIIRVSSFL